MSATVSLNAIDDKDAARIADGLRLTRSRMTSLLAYFQPLFDTHITHFEDRRDLTDGIAQWIAGNYTLAARQYKILFAHLFFGEGNIDAAATAWPQAMRVAIRTATENDYVSLSLLTSLIREYSPSWVSLEGRTVMLSLDRLRGMFTTGLSNSATYMSVDDCIRPIISKVFETRNVMVKVFDKLPDNELAVFNSEAETVVSAVEILQALRQSNIFIRQSAVPYAEKDVRLIASLTDAAELFAGKPIRQLSLYRTRAMMFVLQLATAFKPKDTPLDIPLLLRRYFNDDLWGIYAQYVNVAMPYINRLNVAATDNYSTRYIKFVYTTFKKLSVSGSTPQWIQLESFVAYIIDSLPANSKYGINAGTLSHSPVENTLSRTRITPGNVMPMFTRGLIYGLLMILVSNGLAEVAYEQLPPDEDMPFDIFTHIRITGLGQYVLGLTDRYEAAGGSGTSKATVLLDPDNLVILATSTPAANTIRKLIGEKVTPGRYIVTEKSALAGVTTEAELRHKIKTLKSMAKCELPPLWQKFFDNLKPRISKISPMNVKDYDFFQVNDNCNDLQRIICNDSRIRKIVRLIEGGAFMAKSSDRKTLRTLFGEHGYALPDPICRYF